MGGEALQRLSNGCLYAVKHKVGLTGHKSRHSLAFFLDPRPDALLEPIDGVCSNRKKKMYCCSKNVVYYHIAHIKGNATL